LIFSGNYVELFLNLNSNIRSSVIPVGSAVQKKEDLQKQVFKGIGNGKYSTDGSKLGLICAILRLNFLNKCHHHTGLPGLGGDMFVVMKIKVI
jgi:hypothetical protein